MSLPFDPSELESPTPAGALPPLGDAVDVPEDVYARIVEQVRTISESTRSAAEDVVSDSPHLPFPDSLTPRAPANLHETGLSLSQLADLVLKLMYLHGALRGFEIARQVRLPYSVVSEALDFLKTERCVEVSSGDVVGGLSWRFLLTDKGRSRARDAFGECRYVGPAPVSLEHYTRQCRLQSVQHVSLSGGQLRSALQQLVIDADFFQRLGPAVCSGQSIFLHGPPGNGKTVIAKALGHMLNESGGAIYVPYSISVDQQIISVFDPTLHRVVEEVVPDSTGEDAADDHPLPPDGRWRRVRRPVVIAGGELSLEMLDLRYHAASGFYTAPIQLKANGGVFLLDDFGRQLVPPRQLLNRWILPLEERTDYLTLATGKKFSVPFEQLIIFSTNLRPEDLVDEAFLRRIRHKIEVPPPTEKQFREIFRRCCEQRHIKYDDWIVTRLLSTQYNPQTPPKSSDPRDLLDVIEAICRFRGERPHLSEKIVFEAFQECLGGLLLSN